MEKTIAIDIDEVLADTLPSFLVYYNQKHSTNFKKPDFLTYDWWETFGISKEEAINDFYDFMFSSHSIEIPPIKGSQKALDFLKNKFRLISITNRPYDFKDHTLAWLKINFQNVLDNVYFGNIHSKNGKPHITKLEIMKNMKVDYLIEDQVKIALECANHGIKVFLFSAPWNINQEIPSGLPIIKVSSWDEIVDNLMKNA